MRVAVVRVRTEHSKALTPGSVFVVVRTGLAHSPRARFRSCAPCLAASDVLAGDPGSEASPRLSRRSAGATKLSVLPNGDRCTAPRRSGAFRHAIVPCPADSEKDPGSRSARPRQRSSPFSRTATGAQHRADPGSFAVRSCRAPPTARKTPALTPLRSAAATKLPVLPDGDRCAAPRRSGTLRRRNDTVIHHLGERPRLSLHSAGATKLPVLPDCDRCAAPRRSAIFRRRSNTVIHHLGERPRLSRRSAAATKLPVLPDGDRCAAPRRSGIFRRAIVPCLADSEKDPGSHCVRPGKRSWFKCTPHAPCLPHRKVRGEGPVR
jgi:hypothetical protein